LTQEEIIFRNLFASRSIAWTDLKSLDKPLPVLPEGIIVKTNRGNIFVGSGLDASDEMQQIMIEELAQVRQDLAFIAAAKMRNSVLSPQTDESIDSDIEQLDQSPDIKESD
jgi:hypothetical protein